MRGLMFNYFLSYIDDNYGYEIVDKIITQSAVPNDGAYANAQLYDDSEFLKLMKMTSDILEIEPSQIQFDCGKYTFKDIYEKLTTLYDQDTHKHNSFTDAFDFISQLEIIHYKEVAKLYPDSDFPHFDVVSRNENMMDIRYRSKRHLPFLAKGFLEGCITYFKEPLSLNMQDESNSEATRFIIQKV